MAKTKFTPGPWKVSINSAESPTVIPANGDYDTGWRGDEYLNISAGFELTDTTVANASLIAAAPEMYKMLDNIKGYVEWQEIDNSCESGMSESIEKLLAKARGEQE